MNQIDFYKAKLEFEIDSWDLSEFLKSENSIVVVDTRSQEAYMNENIPGSINIPHRAMDLSTTNELDKTKLYVTYCDGIGCNASTKGALKMTELGFKVKELLGGIDWWVRDGYSTLGKNSQEGSGISCGC